MAEHVECDRDHVGERRQRVEEEGADPDKTEDTDKAEHGEILRATPPPLRESSRGGEEKPEIRERIDRLRHKDSPKRSQSRSTG